MNGRIPGVWHLILLIGAFVATAVVLAVAGVPGVLPPIFLVVSGIALFAVPLFLAAPEVRGLVEDARAVEEVPLEELPTGWRVRFFPVLAATGLVLVPIGIVWLVFVDWKLALVAIAVCFLLIITPGLVRAVRPGDESAT